MQIMDEQSIVFKINDQAVPSYNYSPNNGKFSSMLHLKPGANIYVVIATNSCGSTSQEISIIYEPNRPYKEPYLENSGPEPIINKSASPNSTKSSEKNRTPFQGNKLKKSCKIKDKNGNL